jgi:hypothetical protein
MLDPELKAEFVKIQTQFVTLEEKITQKISSEIDSLARSTARGFQEVYKRFEQVDERFGQVDERFEKMELRLERIDSKLQNQIDTLIGQKADRSELAAIHATFRNLKPA